MNTESTVEKVLSVSISDYSFFCIFYEPHLHYLNVDFPVFVGNIVPSMICLASL